MVHHVDGTAETQSVTLSVVVALLPHGSLQNCPVLGSGLGVSGVQVKKYLAESKLMN